MAPAVRCLCSLKDLEFYVRINVSKHECNFKFICRLIFLSWINSSKKYYCWVIVSFKEFLQFTLCYFKNLNSDVYKWTLMDRQSCFMKLLNNSQNVFHLSYVLHVLSYWTEKRAETIPGGGGAEQPEASFMMHPKGCHFTLSQGMQYCMYKTNLREGFYAFIWGNTINIRGFAESTIISVLYIVTNTPCLSQELLCCSQGSVHKLRQRTRVHTNTAGALGGAGSRQWRPRAGRRGAAALTQIDSTDEHTLISHA